MASHTYTFVVHNVPLSVNTNEFKAKFGEFKGFKDANLVLDEKTNMFIFFFFPSFSKFFQVCGNCRIPHI